MGSHVAGQAPVRYFGSAKAAAGTRIELIAVPVGASVDDLIAALAMKHGDALSQVLARASFLLDEIAARNPQTMVPDGADLDVPHPSLAGDSRAVGPHQDPGAPVWPGPVALPGDLRGDLQLISVHDLVHELLPASASGAQWITCGAH